MKTLTKNSTTFRDDRAFGYTLDKLSVHSYTKQIEKSKVAINNWGGWFDASTADAVIKTFLTLDNHQRAVLGPWNHGATQNASPYQTPASLRAMQSYEWLRFFDYHLKGIDSGLDSEKRLYYFTIGEERWKTTNVWPIAGMQMVPQVGGEVIYPDRAEEDKKLLTYTSDPLEADVEITGHPVVALFITSTHTDGAFYV